MTLPRPVARSRRLYARLMRLYPPRFRAAYAEEMVQVFTESCADAYASRGMAGLAAAWARALGDLAVNASLERGGELKRMWSGKTVGVFVVAILAGLALGSVNLHNDEVQAPLAILLLSTFLLGLGAPRGTWRWAEIVGLAVPLSWLLSLKIGVFYPCRPGHLRARRLLWRRDDPRVGLVARR